MNKYDPTKAPEPHLKSTKLTIVEEPTQQLLSSLDGMTPYYEADENCRVIKMSIQNKYGEEVVVYTDTTTHRVAIKD